MMKRQLLKFFLVIIVSIVFSISAYTILSGNKAQASLLVELGLSNYALVLGLINILIIFSLWSRKTRYIGIFVGTAYLGGAIASELSIGNTGFAPILTMFILWAIKKLDVKSSPRMTTPKEVNFE